MLKVTQQKTQGRLINPAINVEPTKLPNDVFFIISGAVLTIAATTSSWFLAKNRLNNTLKQLSKTIEEQQKKITELNQLLDMKILQSKFNPHFLFNSLNAIQYHIGANDKKNALQYITRFSSFLRNVLQRSDEVLTTVAVEASLAEQYLWLEQNRFPNRFKFSVKINNGAEDAYTPPLLVHSNLEQALYNHILSSNKIADYFVQVDFIKMAGTLIIRVCDNGMGNSEAIEQQTGKVLPESKNKVLVQRLLTINSSAIKPVKLKYKREDNKNICELTIPQPLFKEYATKSSYC
jgi:LytS/YehU family sensor histidine kinase